MRQYLFEKKVQTNVRQKHKKALKYIPITHNACFAADINFGPLDHFQTNQDTYHRNKNCQKNNTPVDSWKIVSIKISKNNFNFLIRHRTDNLIRSTCQTPIKTLNMIRNPQMDMKPSTWWKCDWNLILKPYKKPTWFKTIYLIQNHLFDSKPSIWFETIYWIQNRFETIYLICHHSKSSVQFETIKTIYLIQNHKNHLFDLKPYIGYKTIYWIQNHLFDLKPSIWFKTTQFKALNS